MNGCSVTDVASMLTRVHPDQIRRLVEIIRNTTVCDVRFVESLYRDQALHFDDTLSFLKQIGWVSERAGELTLTQKHPGDRFEAMTIIDQVMAVPGTVQQVLTNYLADFTVEAGQIVHRPTLDARVRYSGIRNILMACGAVSHDQDEDCYKLVPEFAHIFVWARNVGRESSKAEFTRRLQERDEFGASAELAALEWEKQRVPPQWHYAIEHVSARVPTACFDIQSVTLNGEYSSKRFIEVKAVSATTWEFYWSFAEFEAASLLGESYFLYLVPATGRDQFDCSKMQVIQNPYVTVYKNGGEWEKIENVVVCRRK